MQYMVNTEGECPEFPKLSKRVKYFKEEQEGMNNMCEVVEAYVNERTPAISKSCRQKDFNRYMKE